MGTNNVNILKNNGSLHIFMQKRNLKKGKQILGKIRKEEHSLLGITKEGQH
jgi:hypothetical protein